MRGKEQVHPLLEPLSAKDQVVKKMAHVKDETEEVSCCWMSLCRVGVLLPGGFSVVGPGGFRRRLLLNEAR